MYQKRLCDHMAAAEKGIAAYNQQIEALNKHLEGLKRALQLFESDESAITELLPDHISLTARFGAC